MQTRASPSLTIRSQSIRTRSSRRRASAPGSRQDCGSGNLCKAAMASRVISRSWRTLKGGVPGSALAAPPAWKLATGMRRETSWARTKIAVAR